jgi:galactose mutarotase-like enzyme
MKHGNRGADYEAAAATLVGSCDAPPELGTSSAGHGYTIIVPANRIRNDNFTSNRPCKNYPLTITR